jgi:uncharacterized protein
MNPQEFQHGTIKLCI